MSPCSGSRVLPVMSDVFHEVDVSFERGPQECQGNSATHQCAEFPTHSAMTRPSKNGLALAAWYHKPGTTASRLWEGRFLHWAAYAWQWRIDIIFVWRKHENMSPCTGSSVNTSYERVASCAGCQFLTRASGSQGNSATRYYAECPYHSAMTRPSKNEKRTSISICEECPRIMAHLQTTGLVCRDCSHRHHGRREKSTVFSSCTSHITHTFHLWCTWILDFRFQIFLVLRRRYLIIMQWNNGRGKCRPRQQD